MNGSEATIQPFSTFYLFSVALSAGAISVLPLVPARVFGRRFFLLISLVSIFFYVLALVGRGLAIEPLHLCAAGLLVFYQLTLPPQPGADSMPPASDGNASAPGGLLKLVSTGFLIFALGAAWAGIIRETWLLPQGFPENPAIPWSESFRTGLLLNSAASALLIGLSVGSMTLGHWYLVSASLSFEPLQRLTGILCLAVLARLGTSAFSMWSQAEYWNNTLANGLTGFLLGDGLFVACRFILGILLPGVLAVLAWRCSRIHSNQSATGILYVLVAFVFFGEILSKHFLANLGLGL